MFFFMSSPCSSASLVPRLWRSSRHSAGTRGRRAVRHGWLLLSLPRAPFPLPRSCHCPPPPFVLPALALVRTVS